MLEDLRAARVHLCKARTLLRRHPAKYPYTLILENLDYDIDKLWKLINDLEASEPIPTQEAIPHD